MIRLIIDGLWFYDLFGLDPPEKELRKDLLEWRKKIR
ncbi:hypothetical protein KFZ56_04835 [Virgibacillus sp. NKC19-3]|nr:hypothetical protein [Virgibacillus sp. NKC19-3]